MNGNKKKIIVFGGSFNPPTLGHIALAEHLLNQADIEKILFLPASNHYPKPGLLSASLRVDMLRSLLSLNKGFGLSLVEVNAERLLNTVESMRRLKKEYPESQLYFLMGSDNLLELPKWDQGEDLLAEFHLYIMGRNGVDVVNTISADPLLKRYAFHLHYDSSFKELPISSTEIRRCCREGKPITHLVSPTVGEYIKTRSLYLNETASQYS